MFEKVISRATRKNLETLTGSGILHNFYMAGGTTAALYLGHRVSLDLDFFTRKDFDNRTMIERLKRLGELSVEKESFGTIWVIFNGIKVSFFVYKYPVLRKGVNYKNVELASLLDIASMKISAISSRGTKRDFIDLYVICKRRYSLNKVLEAFEKKYNSINYNMIHILKSIAYFDDADKDPMPKMLIRLNWPDVKRYFENEVS